MSQNTPTDPDRKQPPSADPGPASEPPATEPPGKPEPRPTAGSPPPETSRPAQTTSGPPPEQPAARAPSTQEANQWAMFLHFSIFAGILVPYAGLVLPIILWQVKKDEYPSLTPHAHVVINWIISALIYSVVCAILTLLVIGLLGFLVLGILCIVFPLIGGIKANEGEVWEYPLSIRFLK